MWPADRSEDMQLTTRNFAPAMEISNGKWQPKANNQTTKQPTTKQRNEMPGQADNIIKYLLLTSGR